MSYYKFTTPDALAAWKYMHDQEDQLRLDATAFAARFDAKPVFKTDATARSFYGLRFNSVPYKSSSLWAKPDGRNGHSCRPLSTPKKGMREEFKALQAEWNEHCPKNRVDRSSFYESIGLDWGMLILTGIEYFGSEDAVYINTSAKPKDSAGGIEILGSEYFAARKAKADK